MLRQQTRFPNLQSAFNLSGVIALAMLASLFASSIALGQEDEPNQPKPQPKPTKTRAGHLVRVPLPITNRNALSVRQAIERLVERAPSQIGESRQAIVLEFDTSNGKTGQGSELEACQGLARYLVDQSLQRVQTVAYLPVRRGYVPENDDGQVPLNKLEGHAVLVAIACDVLAMHDDSALGDAGIDDENEIERSFSRSAYEIVANHRARVPAEFVMSLVDSERELHYVETDDRKVFADGPTFRKLTEDGSVEGSDTLSERGKPAMFTSQELEEYGLLRHRVPSRPELARQLKLQPSSLEGDPSMGREWNPVLVKLSSFVDARAADWMIRSIGSKVASSEENTSKQANLLIVQLENSDGDADACLRLARTLAELDSNLVRTVAFVDGYARGPAGLVALSCDQLIMTKGGSLGGPTESKIAEGDLGDFQEAVKYLAQQKQTDWSLMMAMLNPEAEVRRYDRQGQIRLLSEEQLKTLENPAEWVPQGAIDMESGLSAADAEKMFVARTTVSDMSGVESFYQLESVPKPLQPTVSDRWIESLANKLASPEIAMLLLFGAMFMLSTEMSAPGIGIPGFLGTLCLMAFFWSQHLDGNANWLEIMLFVVGIIFILLEMFVVPGFGVFGIGGLLMVVCGIGLATQESFPNTTEELAQLPRNLLPLLGAFAGIIVALVMLRNVLPNAPYFKRMMLEPHKREETGLENDVDREAVVDYSNLLGKPGVAATRLAPAGKAMIQDKLVDVITDGRMVDKGQKIEVIEAAGNRIVVQAVEQS